MGTFIGGHELRFIDNNNNNGQQLRNYDRNFIISISITLLALVLLVFIKVNRKKIDDENVFEPILEENSTDSNNNLNGENFETIKKSKLKKLIHLFTDDARKTINCFLKARQNGIQRHLFLLIGILFFLFVNYFGIDDILLQFTQEVYQFNAETFSNVTVFIKIIPMIILLISSHFLINYLQLTESTLLILAILSGFGKQILIGLFSNLYAFLIAIIIGWIILFFK